MQKQEQLARIDKAIQDGPYKANWESLKNIPVPENYLNVKFGIFVHWGLYSVAAFNNEWYSRNMYIKDSPEFLHHIKTFGPHKTFGYKDFIPLFKAEKFNADEWLDLFAESGAKYLMPVSEHHDGFQMYKSKISRYNAFEMGPQRDILAELKEACDKRGITFCVSNHRIEHWWFMGNGNNCDYESDIDKDSPDFDFYAPAAKEPANHFDLQPENPPTDEFLQDWLIRCVEIVDKYKPRVWYFDWWIQVAAAKPYLKKFAAYYYNKGVEWGTPVVINYKHDAFPYGGAVPDIERGHFAALKPRYWQACTSCAYNSWCYTAQNSYKTAKIIITDLIDIVSKNGCLLLNIGPKADGSIPQEEIAILRDIGAWLKVNGEAIYNTRHFKIYGEGSTEIKEGFFTESEQKTYNSSDIRFTMNGGNLYAAVLEFPENGEVLITSLAANSHVWSGIIRDIKVLGYDSENCTTLEYTRNDHGLLIKTKGIKSDLPVVFKIVTD